MLQWKIDSCRNNFTNHNEFSKLLSARLGRHAGSVLHYLVQVGEQHLSGGQGGPERALLLLLKGVILLLVLAENTKKKAYI